MRSTHATPHTSGVYTLQYHFVWCSQYRRNVLQGAIADRLTTLLHEKANALGITIEDLAILPDHVHLFVAASPSYAPQHLVYYFKRYTSHVLRAEFPALKTSLSSLWTRSYYVGSAGQISEDAIQQYIEQQKRR